MENPEEILHSLEEFSKHKPRDIPRELEEYLCFVAKTGDPIYQWSAVKSLFKEKLVNVITDFNENSSSIEIPPCPNVEVFNYESMKSFILEKLDAFPAAPFTVQRICELLTTPRKEYNRIDKYMRALEKNILVVSTVEPGNRHASENGEGIVNGLESDHITEPTSNTNDINVEEMDDTPDWSLLSLNINTAQNGENNTAINMECQENGDEVTQSDAFDTDKVTEPQEPDDDRLDKPDDQQDEYDKDSEEEQTQQPIECETNIESVITCGPSEKDSYLNEDTVTSEVTSDEESPAREVEDVSDTNTHSPVQSLKDDIEPVVSSEVEEENSDELCSPCDKEAESPSSALLELPHDENTKDSSDEVEVSGSDDSISRVNSSTNDDKQEECESSNESDSSEQKRPVDFATELASLRSSASMQEAAVNVESNIGKPQLSVVGSTGKCRLHRSAYTNIFSDIEVALDNSSAAVSSSVENERLLQRTDEEEADGHPCIEEENSVEEDQQISQRQNEEQPMNLAVETPDSSEDRDACRLQYGFGSHCVQYSQQAFRRTEEENNENNPTQAQEETASSSTVQIMEVDIPDVCHGGGHTVEE